MTKWEYKTVLIEGKLSAKKEMEEYNNVLKECGLDGWELCNSITDALNIGTLLIFKRAINEEE